MAKSNKRRKKLNYDKIISNRFILLLIVTILLFSIVIVKIINVMVINHNKYKEDLSVLTYTTISGSSTPRGRIYDRNMNILVDNKSLKTITYRKIKGTTNKEMLNIATVVASHIDIDYSKINDRNKREYYYAKNKEECDKLVTKKEVEKVSQRKMTEKELEELKISRIKEEKLNFSNEELEIAYIYYFLWRYLRNLVRKFIKYMIFILLIRF